MELAKVTSKGQITIPISIRKKLRVKEGDKILFIEDNGKIILLNSSMEALKNAQTAFTGEAERAGISDEQDILDMIAEMRKERREQ